MPFVTIKPHISNASTSTTSTTTTSNNIKAPSVDQRTVHFDRVDGLAPLQSASLDDTASRSSNTTMSNTCESAFPSSEFSMPSSKAPTKDFFFGRDKELQHLRDIWRHINDGQPIFPAALVWGTSGTGKSQLIDHFLDQSCCTCGERHHPKRAVLLSSDPQAEGLRQQQQQQQQPTRQCSCCYVLRGKYDEYTGNNDPFSAIIQALDDFATQLQHGPPEELQRIQKSVQSVFYADDSESDLTSKPTQDDSASQTHGSMMKQSYDAMAALITVVPSLSILFSDSPGSSSSVVTGASSRSARALQTISSNSNFGRPAAGLARDAGSVSTNSHAMSDMDFGGVAGKNATTANSQTAWNRLCYIFIQFMKAISTPQRPVFLFLDDLQWSSAAGLELLASLLTDTDLHNFLLLGAIRQETDPHNHQAMELSPYAPLQTSFLDRLLCEDNARDAHNNWNGNNDRDGTLLEQITLGNLSLPDCTQWLSHLLHRSHHDSDLKLLASKIHAKTHGNVYFTLQAIEELKRRDIVIHNRTADRWEWHLDSSVNDGLPIGDNIVAIIEMQLKDQPPDLQHALSIAAYIRASFDLEVLQAVLQYIDDHGGVDVIYSQADEASTPTNTTTAWTTDRLYSVLEKALLEGLVTNSIGESRYHFAHDRVQQAAHGLIPFGEVRSKLRLQIGRSLLEVYRMSTTPPAQSELQDQSPKTSAENDDQDQHRQLKQQQQQQQQHELTIRDVDSLLFIAADHLNSAPTKDHLFLLRFNLEVGQKALQMAALSSAAIYLQKAANVLPRIRSPWQEHYGTCLTLFQCRSEVELSMGNYEVGHSIGNEILQRARTLDDKLPTYLTMAIALGREGKVEESLSMSLSVARRLGESPKRFYLMHAMKDLMKIKSFLKNNTDEDILNLPFQKDFRTVMAMQFVCETDFRSFFSGKFLQWLVHALRQVRMTIKYGIGKKSASAFAVLGGIFYISGDDHALVLRCAGIAHKLLTRVRQQSSTVYSITAGWIFPSSEPFPFCIKTLDKGYAFGMESGDFELGLTNLRFRNVLAFYIGYKLQQLVAALEHTIQQHKVYNVTFNNETTIAVLMMTRYLAGLDPIDWSDIERKLERDANDKAVIRNEVHRLITTYSGLPLLAFLFRKYELAQRMIALYRQLPGNATTFGSESTTMLVQGLSAFALYKSTGKAKHKKELKRQIGLVRTFVTKKGSNATSILQLLKAKRLAVNGVKPSLADIYRSEKAYDTAIMVAEKVSLVHYCAIACENAAEDLIRTMKKLPRSKHLSTTDRDVQRLLQESICKYMTRAVAYYNEWGCSIKVKDIQKRRSQYLTLDGSMQLQDANDGRVVDLAGHHHNKVTAGTLMTGSVAPKSIAGRSMNDHDTKWTQTSTKGSMHEQEGAGLSHISSEQSDGVKEDEHQSNDIDDDDDVSVLTDLSG